MGSHIPGGVHCPTGHLAGAGEANGDGHRGERTAKDATRVSNKLPTVLESVHGGGAAHTALRDAAATTAATAAGAAGSNPCKSPSRGDNPDLATHPAFNAQADEQAAKWATFAYAWNALVSPQI